MQTSQSKHWVWLGIRVIRLLPLSYRTTNFEQSTNKEDHTVRSGQPFDPLGLLAPLIIAAKIFLHYGRKESAGTSHYQHTSRIDGQVIAQLYLQFTKSMCIGALATTARTHINSMDFATLQKQPTL